MHSSKSRRPQQQQSPDNQSLQSEDAKVPIEASSITWKIISIVVVGVVCVALLALFVEYQMTAIEDEADHHATRSRSSGGGGANIHKSQEKGVRSADEDDQLFAGHRLCLDISCCLLYSFIMLLLR